MIIGNIILMNYSIHFNKLTHPGWIATNLTDGVAAAWHLVSMFTAAFEHWYDVVVKRGDSIMLPRDELMLITIGVSNPASFWMRGRNTFVISRHPPTLTLNISRNSFLYWQKIKGILKPANKSLKDNTLYQFS